MAKLAKAAVRFEHPAKEPHHCAQCRHFHADDRTCEIVAGIIAPRDWCEKFAAKHSGKAEARERHYDTMMRSTK